MDYFESINVELKREYTPEIRKEVVAFANTQGGTVYVGVADDGQVVGLESADKVELQIVNTIRDAIKPDITMFTECVIERVSGHSIIKVSVQRGTNRPYYLADKGLRPSGVYVRQGSASVPASLDAIRQMIKETDGDRYEDTRSLNQELTFECAATEFLKRNLELGAAQMKTLGLKGSDGLYSNLGLLLSDQCMHTIKLACFEGTDKGVFKDRREFGGSLLRQLIDAYAHIELFNRTNATFYGLERIDNRDYPEQAIREALLNAIVHREYAFSGSTLINIYDDRIEFVSLGGLVPGLSIDDIMLGVSQTRNEKLANVFYRLRLIEAYGTGIAKIMSSYGSHASKPVVKATDGAFMVVLPNRNYKSAVSTISTETIRENPQAEQVLGYLATRGTITRRDVEQLLDVKQSRAYGVIRSMLEDGLIYSTNNGKNTQYKLRRKP